jgi:hypothetical protein
MNTFGRYSLGKFRREGGGALGIAGGPQFVGIAGTSESRNQSLAYGIDTAVSPSLLVDFRFGWFQYKVDVLPADFGTTPAADAGIPNLNNDATFTSGLPSLFMRGNQPDMNWGYGLGVNGCNCPLAENEKQWQMVGNITKIWGNHTSKAGIDVRRAYNLRVPSDQHRSGELTFNALRTSNAGVGGLVSPRSCSVTSPMVRGRRSPATSAPAPTRASGSGGTSTTRRTRGAPTRS